MPGSESGGTGGGAGNRGEGEGGGESTADETGDGGGGGSATGDAAGDSSGGTEVAADNSKGAGGAGGQGRSSEGDPFGEDGTGGRASGHGGDEEFEESLGDFDREIGRQQEEIAREGGGPAADSAVIGRDESAGVGGGEGGPGKTTGSAPGAESPGVEVRDLGPDTQAVATVEGCNDPDRVARQLCEAATKEDDPFLRAALWDEYNEYKKLLAR